MTRTRPTTRLAAACIVLALATAGFVGCDPFGPDQATTTAADVYAYANRCQFLKDETTGRYVARDALGFTASATKSGATPFRMQATALGRYLLWGTGGQMPQSGALGVTATTTPGPKGDWRMSVRDGRLGFTNLSTGKGLSVTATGRLGQSAATHGRWSLSGATGCTAWPEITTNITGTPLKGSSPTARVRGFLDAHTHIGAYEFLGGRFHCGRPWSPYGVTVALQDCPDHEPNGAAAVAENFFVTGTPVGTHSTDGWPNFDGWPRPESLTHEGTYWKWLERAWRGGLRVVVNDLVENRALCEIYPLKKNDCDEMASVRLQAKDMAALQDYIDAQFGGPGKGFFRIVTSPAEARRVINSGKLAVVLGVEVSEVLGCGKTGGTPDCDKLQIDRELDELYRLGVRSLFPVHKFDNALGGTPSTTAAPGSWSTWATSTRQGSGGTPAPARRGRKPTTRPPTSTATRRSSPR